MDPLTNLAFLRKHYSELLKLFFYEIQKGAQLHELTDLSQVDSTRVEIERLEKDLDINKQG